MLIIDIRWLCTYIAVLYFELAVLLISEAIPLCFMLRLAPKSGLLLDLGHIYL